MFICNVIVVTKKSKQLQLWASWEASCSVHRTSLCCESLGWWKLTILSWPKIGWSLYVRSGSKIGKFGPLLKILWIFSLFTENLLAFACFRCHIVVPLFEVQSFLFLLCKLILQWNKWSFRKNANIKFKYMCKSFNFNRENYKS